MTIPDPQNPQTPQPSYAPPAAQNPEFPAAPAYSEQAPAYPGQAPAYAGAAPAAVPGRTLSIVGLILAFVAAPVGMILSLVARSKLKKAGAPTGLATAGFWVGLIITLFEIIGIVLMVVAFASLFSMCGDLGPGVHELNGVTYTCG